MDLQPIWDSNPLATVLFVFSDGNVFTDENAAKSHKKDCKDDYQAITKEQPKQEMKSEEKPTNKKQK